MSSPKTQIQNILSQNISKKETVILGLSGGSDSIFLLHQLLEFQKTSNIKIITAHFNHKLRGKESDNESLFVKNFINNFPEIIHEEISVDIKKKQQQKKDNLEATARHERYLFFHQLALKYQCSIILTAHHADDNIETIFLNLIRGTTLNGLTGIKIKSSLPIQLTGNEKIRLLRPLLYTSKKEIIEDLTSKKIPYCTDSSNTDNNYNRNYLRNCIIPLIKNINPNLTSTITQNINSLNEINNFIKKETKSWINQNIENQNQSIIFSRKSFLKNHIAIQKEIILSLHNLLIGNQNNIQNININEVIELIENNIGNKQKKFGQTTFYLRNNIVKISKNSKNETRK